ncbi:phosphoribosyltransferase [Microbacterium awajiense]|uniref:Phosphoribosyltransferase n=1 Tax=Microbacterium awajiense TaxID=415214 RepID=A0ABP7A4C1_9MICO
MAIFADRVEAGRQLAPLLEPWASPGAVVFGIARGGVVVAAPVARHLGAPLRAAVVRKLGSPGNEEYAIGAIADSVRVLDADAVARTRITSTEVAEVEARERAELARRRGLFGASVADNLAEVTAIVIDDGIATGSTATAACRSLRARGAASVVLAVPVAPARWEPEVGTVDAYVCPHREHPFWAVGPFYRDFRQTTDAEVAAALDDDPASS